MRLNEEQHARLVKGARKGGFSTWSKMSKAERSKEMSRRRRLGHERVQEVLRKIREEGE